MKKYISLIVIALSIDTPNATVNAFVTEQGTLIGNGCETLPKVRRSTQKDIVINNFADAVTEGNLLKIRWNQFRLFFHGIVLNSNDIDVRIFMSKMLNTASEKGYFDVVKYFIEDCCVRVEDQNRSDWFDWIKNYRTSHELKVQINAELYGGYLREDFHAYFRCSSYDYEKTALIRAINNGHLDIAEYLLSQGANIDAGGQNGTGFMQSCRKIKI